MHLCISTYGFVCPSVRQFIHQSVHRSNLRFVVFKGDIFSSLENVVLVANVNKNYRSHSHLQRSGLIVSSVLKYWRSCPFCRSLPVQSSAILFLFNKSKLELRKNSGKNRLPQIQFRLDVWLVSMEWLLSRSYNIYTEPVFVTNWTICFRQELSFLGQFMIFPQAATRSSWQPAAAYLEV